MLEKMFLTCILWLRHPKCHCLRRYIDQTIFQIDILQEIAEQFWQKPCEYIDQTGHWRIADRTESILEHIELKFAGPEANVMFDKAQPLTKNHRPKANEL